MLVGTARTALSAGQGKFCAKVSGFRRRDDVCREPCALGRSIGLPCGDGALLCFLAQGLSQMGLVWNRSSDSRSAK